MRSNAQPPGGTTRSGLPRWAIPATIAAAAVVVAVLIAISAAGGGDDGATAGPLNGVDEVLATLQGVPQAGATLGNPDAAIAITEFVDLQCPFCADAATTVVPRLVEQYVRPGTAKLTLVPMAFIGPDSTRGALAAAAAGNQNRMWDWVEVAYRNQGAENSGWLTDAFARDVATAVGMDAARFEDDRGGAEAQAFVEASAAAAQRAGVQSTPTFIVTGPRGSAAVQDYRDAGQFDAAIAKVR